MKLKELEANIYAHLRAKLPRLKRGFLDNRPTNEDYINDRIREMNIPQLIERFGGEMEVGDLYLNYGLPKELPSEIIIRAVRAIG